MSSTGETLIGLVHPKESPALASTDKGWGISHAGMLDRVDALAKQLSAAGVAEGSAVALLMDHEPETVLAFLAVARLNAIAMPLNRQLRAREMSAAFEDCTPALVLLRDAASKAAGEVSKATAAPVREVTGGENASVAEVGSGTGGLPDPDPEAVALLLHTSGTTSRPKAVPLRQRNLAATARCIAEGYRLGEEDVSYCVMPLFHVHGLVASVLAALSAGGAVAIPRRVRPSAVWSHAAEHAVTWTSAVPTMLGKFPPVEDEAGRSLRFVRSCSSALSPTLWDDLEDRFSAPVVEAYGMTEAAHQIASNPLPPAERRAGTVGLSTGTEVAILDEDWKPVAAGETGEVTIRGPGVVEGYLDNAEANASSFRDGRFRTGDLGRLSDDGYITLEGRLKEQINRGGEKVAPREIDEVLVTHPQVLQAVAFGRPDPKLGETVEAAVVLVAPVDASELRAHCADVLASFKVPARFHVVEQIPTGPTGKVQRRLLASAFDE